MILLSELASCQRNQALELYFASGSMLDQAYLKAFCSSARLRGTATATECRLTFPIVNQSGKGIPALVYDESESTYGALYSVNRDDLRKLDDELNVPEVFRRKRIMASYSGSSAARVWTHLATPQEGFPFKPDEQTVNTLLRHAIALHLPEHFYSRLQHEVGQWMTISMPTPDETEGAAGPT